MWIVRIKNLFDEKISIGLWNKNKKNKFENRESQSKG